MTGVQTCALPIWDRGHIFLYNHKWLWGLSEKVDGFSTHPDGIIRLQGVTLRQ